MVYEKLLAGTEMSIMKQNKIKIMLREIIKVHRKFCHTGTRYWTLLQSEIMLRLSNWFLIKPDAHEKQNKCQNNYYSCRRYQLKVFKQTMLWHQKHNTAGQISLRCSLRVVSAESLWQEGASLLHSAVRHSTTPQLMTVSWHKLYGTHE